MHPGGCCIAWKMSAKHMHRHYLIMIVCLNDVHHLTGINTVHMLHILIPCCRGHPEPLTTSSGLTKSKKDFLLKMVYLPLD